MDLFTVLESCLVVAEKLHIPYLVIMFACLHEVWNFTKICFYYTRVFEFKNKVHPKVISPSFKLYGMAYFHSSTFNRWSVRSASITALPFVKIEFQSKI